MQRCAEEVCHALHDAHLAARMPGILELNRFLIVKEKRMLLQVIAGAFSFAFTIYFTYLIVWIYFNQSIS